MYETGNPNVVLGDFLRIYRHRIITEISYVDHPTRVQIIQMSFVLSILFVQNYLKENKERKKKGL